jgi:hypothetical protein
MKHLYALHKTSELRSLVCNGLPGREVGSTLTYLVLPTPTQDPFSPSSEKNRKSEGAANSGSMDVTFLSKISGSSASVLSKRPPIPKVSAQVKGHRVVHDQYALYKIKTHISKLSRNIHDDHDFEAYEHEEDDGEDITWHRCHIKENENNVNRSVERARSSVWRRYSDFVTLARMENKTLKMLDQPSVKLMASLFNPFDESFLSSRELLLDDFLQDLLKSHEEQENNLKRGVVTGGGGEGVKETHDSMVSASEQEEEKVQSMEEAKMLSAAVCEFLGLTTAPTHLFPFLRNIRMHVWLNLSGASHDRKFGLHAYGFAELKVAAFNREAWVDGLGGNAMVWDECNSEAFCEIDLDIDRSTSNGGAASSSTHSMDENNLFEEGCISNQPLNGKERDSLRTILRAVALMLPSVGYCQVK